jgi:NAD(P)-dependent dehydrogenase (short-subunit alcohol dehydrogenase family)
MPELIVVGAGPGLGAGVARRFAAEGFGVGLVARSAASLTEVQHALGSYDVPVTTYRADAGRAEQLERALADAVQDHGVPDVVVYNAAVIRADAPGDLSVDELTETWRVNVAGVLVTAMATVPAMQERRHGTFLVTGGMPRPVAGRLSLSLGKAGVRALTSMLADHFGPSGVHVATVTVAGEIQPDTTFDPDRIADEYWRLHRQTPETWESEVLFDGEG